MATIKVDGLTVSVKGYYLNNNSPYYQVFVPKQLRPLFGQHKASVALHGYDNRQHIDQCQHLNQRFRALFRAIRDSRSPPPQSLHSVAQAWLSEITVEIDAPKVEVPLLLSDAFELYVSNHGRGSDERFRSRQFAHWQRLTKQAGNISLRSLTREHARGYRDARLALGIKQASVQREISSIKAIINVARREAPVQMVNPFDGLTVPTPTTRHESTRRLPFSTDELQQLLTAAIRIDDERRRIVVVLALTGARLAEVVGLRREDVDLKNQAVSITPHKSRSLKTPSSARVLPLLQPALVALTNQLNSHSEAYVFPTYSNDRTTNSNSASATLNKWSQTIVPVKTMHSLRHSMRDLLRNVNCPEEVAKEIGGWSRTDTSSTYGLGTSIEVKRYWLRLGFSQIITHS